MLTRLNILTSLLFIISMSMFGCDGCNEKDDKNNEDVVMDDGTNSQQQSTLDPVDLVGLYVGNSGIFHLAWNHSSLYSDTAPEEIQYEICHDNDGVSCRQTFNSKLTVIGTNQTTISPDPSSDKYFYVRVVNSSGEFSNASSPITFNSYNKSVDFISVGWQAVCMKLESNEFDCVASNNSSEQLGNSEDLDGRVLKSENISVNKVKAGYERICYTDASKSLFCRGLNDNNQISASSDETIPDFTEITFSGDVEDFSIFSMTHTCALLSDNTVQCLGANSDGQLGDNAAPTGSSSPVAVNNISNVTKIESSRLGATCALQSNNELHCWGNSAGYTTGRGTSTDFNEPDGTPTLSNVIDFDMGYLNGCAVINDGTVQCWGVNSKGIAGNGTSTGTMISPTVIGGLSDVKEVQVGYSVACALHNDKTVSCWGNSTLFGETGLGTYHGPNTPTKIPGLSNVKQIAINRSTLLILAENGQVSISGIMQNITRQLSLTSNHFRPTNSTHQLTPFTGAKEISIGSRGGCFVDSQDDLNCFGANENGHYGNGSWDGAGSEVSSVTGISNPKQFSMTYATVCAIDQSDTPYCWGKGNSNALGNGGSNHVNSPVVSLDFPNAKAVQPASGTTCFITNSDSVSCVGQGTSGELGNGTSSTSSIVVAVSGLTGSVSKITGGVSHFCALISDNSTVQCWGRNDQGQVGDGTTTNRNTATTVGGLNNVTDLIADRFHSCAINNLGEVYCWGKYADTASQANSSTPVKMKVQSPVKDLAVGESSCVIDVNDQLVCWGSTGYFPGYRGANDVVQESAIYTIGTPTRVWSGGQATCYKNDSEAVYCWGERLPTEFQKLTPVPLSLQIFSIEE